MTDSLESPEQLRTQIDALRQRIATLESRLRRQDVDTVGSPCAAIEWDSQLRVARWPKEAVVLFGWTEAEALGRTPTELAILSDVDQQAIHEWLKMPVSVHGEQRLKTVQASTKSGRSLHSNWIHRPSLESVRQQAGTKSDAFRTFVCDVSAQRKSDRLLRTVMDLVPHEIFAKDDQGNFVMSNKAHAASYGLEPQDVVGRNEMDLSPVPTEAEKFHRDDLEVIRSGLPKFIPEEVYTDHDGNRHVLQTSKVPFLIDETGVQGVLGVAVDVSELKEAEAVLRASEQRNRIILANVPDHIVIHDRDGVVSFINHVGETLDVEQVVGVAGRDLVAPDSRRVIDESIAHVVRTQEACDGEFTDFAGRTYTARWSPFEIENGEVNSVLAIATDVTDQRATEEVLRLVAEGTAKATGEDFFDLLVGHLSRALSIPYVMVATVNDDQTVARPMAFWSRDSLSPHAPYQIDGTPTERMLADGLYFVPEALSVDFPTRSILQDRRVESCIGMRLASSAGQPLGVLACFDDRPLVVEGPLMAVLQIFADRAASELERTAAENQLRDSEGRFRQVATHAPVGIATLDADGHATYVNPECCRIVGLSSEECLGRGWASRLHPDDSHRVGSNWQRSVKEERPFESEHRFLSPDGFVRWVRVVAVPHRTGAGAAPTWITMTVDITEQERSKQRLSEQQSMLAHASRLSTMGEMMAGIAHELNQPLSAISNYSSACGNVLDRLDDLPADNDLGNWLREIGVQAVRCGEIIRGLREFLKKGDDKWGVVELNDVVSDSIALVQSGMADVATPIQCELRQPSPRVFASHVQLQQVLVNLLRNAYDATEHQPHPEILVSTEIEDHVVRLIVRDSGLGIREADVERLFTAFFTTKAEGLGMGLAISKSIIDAHDGQLRLVASNGSGTCFQVELPLAN